MNRKNIIINNKYVFNSLHYKKIKIAIKNGENIFSLSEKINDKNNKILFIFYIISILIIIFFIYICINGIFVRFVLQSEIIKIDENIIKSIKNKKKYITVNNYNGEPDTTVEIIIENKLNYIPKISVIVPVNDEEIYLSECLETIMNQTLKEIEIICIDDGSKDNSLNIMRKYAEKDSRFSVIKEKNYNAGLARNAGIQVAKGLYLSFIDSDDLLELNMLEEMYLKITKEKADIIISQCKTINSDTKKFNEKILNNSLNFELIPFKNKFSVKDVPDNIFQICEGWAWDKLFRRNFIIKNKIKFLSIKNFNDNQFTYTALCLAGSITTIPKKLYIKRYQLKKSLTKNRWRDPLCFLSSFEKIKSNLLKNGLYEIVKESFWKWVIKLCIIQLKNLDNESKFLLYNVLHKKFNEWDYIDRTSISSNSYRALHYIKYQKDFPVIYISYIVNKTNYNFCLISIVSLLKNTLYENLHIILLYNGLNLFDLEKINKLKEIRFFTFESLYISDSLSKQLKERKEKEIWYINILADKFPDINKVLYLDCNTLIRKSLLPLWEIDMKDRLIAFSENILSKKYKTIKFIDKDDFYFNPGVLLLNIKEWRKMELNEKIMKFLFNKDNNFDSSQYIRNILASKKISLIPKFNSIEIYDTLSLEKINKKGKKINTNHFEAKFYTINLNNSFMHEYLAHNISFRKINDMYLTIPIVLSSDDNYAPFIYTAIISILENRSRTTYYTFFILVPLNFSKINENKIISIKDKYLCSINFIYIKNQFENITLNIPHITFPTYYRLLIGDLLPKEIDKCIYLDADICVCKDLSELFNIDIKNNYIAGVIAAGYYFSEKNNCKRLNLPSMKYYVNTGMLLMNLKKIRSDNITQKFIELSNRNYSSQDQDIINVVCFGKILTLPPKYNAMVLRLQENNPLLRKLYKEEDILEAENAPHIIHYADKKKPWNSLGVYMEKYWWDIAKKTPYINTIFKRENIYKNILKKWWFIKKNKPLNLNNPKTFNEKIQWLKLYDSTPIKTRLSDKYLVREWVREKIGEEYLVPLLGVYDKFEDIEFDKLPKQFVIKCNHGYNYNIIVKNKYQLNLALTKTKIDKWMKENFAFRSLEMHYRDIPHKIIIEKFLDDGSGELKDYKFTCFNGKPYFLWVDSNRFSNHKRNLYNLNWVQLPYKIDPHYSTFPSPEKPKCFREILQLATILSEGFTYVRVDFYINKDKIYFGEMTFTSSSGTEDIIPKKFERRLSSLIKLPRLAYNIDVGEYYEISRSFQNINNICFTLISLFLFIIKHIFKKFFRFK